VYCYLDITITVDARKAAWWVKGVYVVENEHRLRIMFRISERSNQGGMDAWSMWHARERRETNTKILVEKPERKRPLGIASATSEDSIKE
jgi:hypothetical protein